MTKIKTFLGTAFAVAMLAPGLALASTSNTFMTFPNSGPNVTTSIGSSVQIKDTIKLTSGSELESISHQLVDNSGNDIGMPEVCDNVADRVVSGTYTVLSDFDLTGGTEGTFGIRTRSYGVTGPGTDNNCGGAVNDNQYYSARVTLTEDQNTGSNANNTGGNSNGGNAGGTGSNFNDFFDTLCKKYPWICAAPATTTPPVTPTHSADCVQLKNLATGLMFGSGGNGNPWQRPAVVSLQNFLISKGGNTIPTGYYGMLTGGAYSQVYGPYGLNCHN